MSDLSLEVEAQDSPTLADLARYTGLSSLEIAAAKTDFHMSTCPLPVWECPDCAHKLKEIRAILDAVTPRIEQPLLAEVDRLRRTVDDVAALTRNTDGNLLHPDSELPVGEFQAVLYPDGAPVATASNPTPIPDGEER